VGINRQKSKSTYSLTQCFNICDFNCTYKPLFVARTAGISVLHLTFSFRDNSAVAQVAALVRWVTNG